jgi:hypothetical protein
LGGAPAGRGQRTDDGRSLEVVHPLMRGSAHRRSETDRRTGAGGAILTGGVGPTGGRESLGGASSGGVPTTTGGASMGGTTVATGGTTPATGGSIEGPSGGVATTQTGGAATSGGSAVQITGGASVVGAGGTAASESGGASDSAGSPAKAKSESDEAGCACRQVRSNSNPGALLALLGLCGLGLRRHRRAPPERLPGAAASILPR